MAGMADALGEALNNPLLYAGLGLMSAGAPRVGQPANVGAELMNALQMYQQQQVAQQQQMRLQAQQRLAEESAGRERLSFEVENAEALRAQEAQKLQREAIQNFMRENPNAAPGDITRALLQATGDPSLLKSLPTQKQPQLMNVPAGGVIFDPNTGKPVFQNPAVPRGAQQVQQPRIITGADGVPRLVTGGGTGSQPVPGFPARQVAQAGAPRAAEAIDIAPGWTIQTKPLTQKERDALVGDVTRFQTLGSNFDRLAEDAAAVLTHPGLRKLSGYRGRVPVTVDPEAFDAQAKLESLRSQIGLGTLQAMREVSKTGGALGNVSNFEVQRLEQNLAAIREGMTYPELQKSLQRVVDHAQSTKDRMGGAIETRYGTPKQQQEPPGASTAPAGKVISRADVEATARASGRTIKEVMQAAKSKGFTVR